MNSGPSDPLHPRPPRTILSRTRRPYTIPPSSSSSHSLLTAPQLRAVDRYLSLNRSHRHSDRSGPPARVIPPLPFVPKEPNGADELLALAVTAVEARESALDVPLRFAAPADFFSPPLEEPPARVPLARRMAALLKGRESVPMHWAVAKYEGRSGREREEEEGGEEGEEEEVMRRREEEGIARLRVMADAMTRAQAAVRAGEREKTARIYCTVAALHYNGGNLVRARQSYANALAAFEAVGDVRGVAFCHNILGVCHHKLREFKVALVHHRKQESLGGCYARAVAQINMGVSYAALEELNFAEQALADALVNARACKDALLESIALGNHGIVCMRMENMRAAQTSLEQCLEKCSLGGDKSGAAICLLLLGELYSRIQDLQHALFYYEHAFRVGGEAQCADVVDVARVNIGIVRGNAALRHAMVQQAERMGQKSEVKELIELMPQ